MEKLHEVGINLKPNIKMINTKILKIDQYCTYAEQLGTLNITK
jgi:hypothetical protein